MTLRVGLTGNIGSGKSTVAKLFEILAVPVYYADATARRLMNENESIRRQLVEVFGSEVYTGRVLNREGLARIVFNDKEKLSLLNNIVHPATIADAADWMQRQHGAYAIKEAALIFESGSEKQLDLVIGVRAPKSLRLQRVVSRDGIDAEAAAARMEKQMDEDEKMSLCDFVIVNDEQHAVIPQVLDIHRAVLSKAAS